MTEERLLIGGFTVKNFIKLALVASLYFPSASVCSAEEKMDIEEQGSSSVAAPSFSSSSAPMEVSKNRGFKPSVRYKIALLGKLKVIKKDLRKASLSFNSKFARRLVSTLADDINELTPTEYQDMLEGLNKVTLRLKEIYDPKFLNSQEAQQITTISEKIDAIKNLALAAKDIAAAESGRANIPFDLSQTEALTQLSFIDLAQTQQDKNLPYLVARVVEPQAQEPFYFDAHTFNQYVFNDYPILPQAGRWESRDDGGSMWRKEGLFGFRQAKNPISKVPLNPNKIEYFSINSLQNPQLVYVASFADLIAKKELQKTFYKNSGVELQVLPRWAFPYDPNNESFLHVRQMVISPDNKLLAAIQGQKISIWDLQNGQKLHTLDIGAADIAMNNQLIVTRPSWENPSIWNARTGDKVRELNKSNSPITLNDRFVVSTNWTVDLQNDNPNIRMPKLKIDNFSTTMFGNTLPTESLDISTNSAYVVAMNKNKIGIFDTQTGDLLHPISQGSDTLRKITISSDSTSIIGIGHNWQDNKKSFSIKKWNIQTGQLESSREIEISDENAWLIAIAIDPKGKFFITGLGKRGRENAESAKVWDVQNGKLLRTLKHDGDYIKVAISPDGKLATTTTDDGDKVIKVWDLSDME